MRALNIFGAEIRHVIAAWLVVFTCPVAQAALNDLYPGDYIPAPAGQTAFVVYLYDRSLVGPYAAGQNSATKDRSVQTAIFLGARYFDIANFRSSIAVSGGRSRQTSDDRSLLTTERVYGLTDPKISITLWPYIDEKNSQYIAVNLAHIFGAGSYDSSAAQNIGQNRDRSILSLAWAGRSSQNTMIEITAEGARFGVNPEYGLSRSRLEQKNAFSVTGFLRYRLTDQFSPYLGAQTNWGGETVVNGVSQADSVRSNRLYLGMRFQPNSNHIFHLRFATDHDVDWAYALRREWTLRWTWLPQ